MSVAEFPSQCQEQSEFQELSSSSSPSSISLKVSMGKKAYQTWDTGDFTFPLTTFRDDLVVMLQDNEGNEISHTGVKISLIVEKGSWDDIFHLEGGGYVHMKLQFILSEDERNRIRNVRESALRKKQDRIPGTNLVQKTAIAVGDLKRELSDRTEGTSSSPIRQNDETQSMRSIALPRSMAEEHAQSKPGVPEINIAAGTKSGSQKKDYHKSSKPEGLVVTEKPLSKPEGFQKKEYEKLSKPEGQVSEKTSSSVRKMISAFETSLSLERRPLAKTQASKSQPNIVGMGGSQKDPLVSKTLRETQTNTGKNSETSRSPLNPVGIKPSYSYKNLESITTTVSSKGNSSTKSSLPIKETDTVSGRTNTDHFGIKTDSGVAEKRGREVSSNISPEIDFQRASNDKLKSIAYSGNEHYDSESSGAWIFPDNIRNLCVTTAGKEVLNFLEDSGTEVNVHQSKKRISLQGKHGSLCGTDPTMKDREKPHKAHELPAEGSPKNSSSGPFGQVFKIAAIIGFGIFVLLNRQKETRTSDTRSKDDKFAKTPDYIDQLTSSEEQWTTLMAED